MKKTTIRKVARFLWPFVTRKHHDAEVRRAVLLTEDHFKAVVLRMSAERNVWHDAALQYKKQAEDMAMRLVQKRKRG